MRSVFARLSLVALLLAAPAALAAPRDTLSLVPVDATTVGYVRISDLRTSPLTSRLFAETDKATADGDAARFMEEAGLQPSEDVDSVLMAMSPGTGEPRVLVAFEGRFDPARLSMAVAKRGLSPVQGPSGSYYLLEKSDNERGAVAFVSSRLTLAGSEAAVQQALAALAQKGTEFRRRSPLSREIRDVDPNATAWLVIDVQRAKAMKAQPNWPEERAGDPMAAALKNVSFVNVWARANGDDIRFSATAKSDDAETRELLEDALRGLLATWRLTVQDKAPEMIPMIRKFEVERDRHGVNLTGTLTAEMIQRLQAQKHAAK
jgi:hypothetical protein